MLLLPATDLAGAAAIAERIRDAVAALAIAFEGSGFGHVTISAGVAAVLPLQDSTAAQLLSSADRALYQAKRDGRNQVVAAAPEPVRQLQPAGRPVT